MTSKNYRNKVLEVARQQLGVSEPSGDDQYIRWYNSVAHTSFNTNVPWCFIFVSWVLRMAEVSEDICPNFASCGVGIEWAKKNNAWKPASSDYTPNPADLIIFDWKADGKQDHVGFVEEIKGGCVYTIEGNTSNKVATRGYDLNDPEIMGYIAIKYPNVSTSVTTEVPSVVVKPKSTVSEAQTILKTKFSQFLSIDNVWGPHSKKALVKAIQKSLNTNYRSWLSVDGVWGQKTQKAWKNILKGNSGDLVTIIQIALVAHGYDIEIDGIFGKDTQKAVKEFQKKHGLVTDGIVGPLTMNKLVK